MAAANAECGGVVCHPSAFQSPSSVWDTDQPGPTSGELVEAILFVKSEQMTRMPTCCKYKTSPTPESGVGMGWDGVGGKVGHW